MAAPQRDDEIRPDPGRDGGAAARPALAVVGYIGRSPSRSWPAFRPARDAAIPYLISGPGREGNAGDGQEHDTGTLELANGITMATSYGMIPVGAGVFGLLLWASNSLGWEGHWRYVLVFWLNAATYLVSYFFIRSIPDLGPAPGNRSPPARAGGRAGSSTGSGCRSSAGSCRASR